MRADEIHGGGGYSTGRVRSSLALRGLASRRLLVARLTDSKVIGLGASPSRYGTHA